MQVYVEVLVGVDGVGQDGVARIGERVVQRPVTVKVCPAWAVPASIVLAEMSAASANPAAIILPRPRAEFALLNWIISCFPCV